jgi:hypothetical protein
MAVYEELHNIWMRCRIAHKRKLHQKITEKVDGWHRYKWLLQRKFPEFRDKEVEINGMSLDELLRFRKEKMPDLLFYSSEDCSRVIHTEFDDSVPGGMRYFEEDEQGNYVELPHYRYNRNCGCKYHKVEEPEPVTENTASDEPGSEHQNQ